MSPTDTMLTGLSQASAPVGLTRGMTHGLRAQGFDLAAALFGAPDAAFDDLPSQAQALLLSGLVLDFTARALPGPGATLRSLDLTPGLLPSPEERVDITGTIVARPDPETAVIAIMVSGPRGRLAEASATFALPVAAVTATAGTRPDIQLHTHRHLAALMARSATLPALTAAVAWPCDRDSLVGPVEAALRGALRPILVGPPALIEATAAAAGASLAACDIIEAATPHEAAAVAVRLCREGRAAALMKGSLHTDELMSAAVARDGGLRTARRLSHVFALDVPSYPKALFVTDAAINILPDLKTKADIVQNAVDLLHALGVTVPKVAILSAVETINPAIPSTLDAAALCKMADRGQITGAILDGPLAFDNAISKAAAAIKNIASAVAGDADILLAPDLEAGNMVAKQLSYLAGADSAGIVLGARVPIILTSRADSVASRLASVALAQVLAAARQERVA
ncbi:bifunctional enoyl-CoA hydratase/phosphate acetyltransferase [Roseomonas fluvialis]|uniref:Bifunctional enoyl-CoA hydratase/phosphate acetyltransferase n=1 Tax=Roseomonas fluvialis TaxID=1750527 RepID=A0ABN6P6L7_9PROT|nr:bifunctional enoyl-CoA hydratase/phosphate acetyltransferase [Roseomonas fluvialis]BDG74320.1 bifunctional enoyl-CoA hydratase/phosphate acetyltransferase [Roseomonas fluvialis]